MTPERWAQVKQAFQSALELAPDERGIYLDGFCAAEPELRKEVESLLRHHHEAGTVMDHPAKVTPELIPGDENDPWIGRNIGPYQTVAKIGQGGMGTVYRAIRVDDHYLKNVAIKLARSGMATGQYLRRFRSERQIMASLDHPNIAHLLDGGTTEEGIPYADPGNTEVRAELARVYAKLAAAHFAASSSPGAKASLSSARSYYQKGLNIWLDLRKQGALRGSDAQAPEQTAAELAKCEVALQSSSKAQQE